MKNILITLSLCFGMYKSMSQTVTVSTAQEFITELSTGATTILLKGGTYELDGVYTVDNGTVVRPESAMDSVFFTGITDGDVFQIRVHNGSTLQGIYFKDIHTAPPAEPYLVEVRNATLQECVFDGRNITRDETHTGAFARVYKGSKIYRNTFYDMWDGGLLIIETRHIGDLDEAERLEAYAKITTLYDSTTEFYESSVLEDMLDAYLEIGGCHIKGNYFFNPKVHTIGGHVKTGNGKFAIKTGNGEVCYGFQLIEENLFHDCSAEDEIVENKGKHSLYRYNTFYQCEGNLSFRNGSNSLAYGNYFIEGKGGVGLWGPKHQVVNNYFYKIDEPIVFNPGRVNTTIDDAMHITFVASTKSLVANNTFVDCGPLQLNDGLGSSSRTAKTMDLKFVNNFFHQAVDNNMFDSGNGTNQDVKDAIIAFNSNLLTYIDTIANDIIPASEDAIFKSAQTVTIDTVDMGDYKLPFPAITLEMHQKSAAIPEGILEMFGKDGDKSLVWENQDLDLSKDMNGKARDVTFKGLGAFIDSPVLADLEAFPGRVLRPSDLSSSFLGSPLPLDTIINVNEPPVVSFIQPEDNAEFDAGSTIVVGVAATDLSGVANVKLYLDDVFLRQESFAPYDWSHTPELDSALKNMAPGTYVIKAIAEDIEGALGEASVTVKVNEKIIIDTIRVPIRVEAESFTANLGLELGGTIDVGEGIYVTNIDNLEWADYESLTVDSTSKYNFNVRVASSKNGGKIGLIIDGSQIAEVTVDPDSTNGDEDWYTTKTAISLDEGLHTVRLEFTGEGTGFMNVNWFEIVAEEPIDTTTVTSVGSELKGVLGYPNPVKTTFNIAFSASHNSTKINVVDNLGKSVIALEVEPDEKMVQIDFTSLPNGLYFVKIVSNSGVKTIKVLKE